jgi:hypothetical protein
MALAAAPSLTEIAGAAPPVLGLAMLRTDRHGRYLDSASQWAAVSDALADGAATAADLRKQFPTLKPDEIAGALGIAVETTDDDPMVASIWRFAEYRSRPPRIVLYRRGLAPLDDGLSSGDKRLLGASTPQDIFVAHELYHHAEAIRSEVPIAWRYQATLLRIGKWKWRTGIAALAEIAAGAFAQSLLDLPCHPRVLDFVATYTIRAHHRRFMGLSSTDD